MADDWLLDQGQDDDEDASFVMDEGESEDARYALTPLGVATLARAGSFAGFGPCAATGGPSLEAAPSRHEPRSPRARRTRSTPLFG